MRRMISALVTLFLIAATPALSQSGRIGWDGTWVGGWDKGAGVQLIFAGDKLIGFYWRDDYKNVPRTTTTPDGGIRFAWDKGDASITRTPNGMAQLLVHEQGKPEVAVALKRE